MLRDDQITPAFDRVHTHTIFIVRDTARQMNLLHVKLRLFALGETLLSPLVMCGPHGTQFLKPVELRLPHCASMTPDGWSFALKSSDTPTGRCSDILKKNTKY